jgi:chromosome segregation ATPase
VDVEVAQAEVSRLEQELARAHDGAASRIQMLEEELERLRTRADTLQTSLASSEQQLQAAVASSTVLAALYQNFEQAVYHAKLPGLLGGCTSSSVVGL